MPQIADKPATSEPGTTRVQPSVSAIIAKRCADRAAELNDGSLRARLDIANVRAAEEVAPLIARLAAHGGQVLAGGFAVLLRVVWPSMHSV